MKTSSTWRGYARCLEPCFLLILAVWLLRLLLDTAHLPRWLVQIVSISVVVPLAVILAVVLLHGRRLASYSRVFLSSFLLISWAQLLIILSIAFYLATGIPNVYIAPEFSMPGDPDHSRHILGHLVAIPFGGLVGWGIGSLVLWLLRRIQSQQANRFPDA